MNSLTLNHTRPRAHPARLRSARTDRQGRPQGDGAGQDHGGGFSRDATVRIAANDRRGLERLLRYCARPPFAAERIEELDRHRPIYHLPKPGPDGRTQLILSPLELVERIAALVPPPRVHRHRYYGVLAPNAPLRAAVTALAPEAIAAQPSPPMETSADEPFDTPHRSPARYLWAMLIARIYEAFPLICPRCGTDMYTRVFITEAAPVQRILTCPSASRPGRRGLPRHAAPRSGRGRTPGPFFSMKRDLRAIPSPSQSPISNSIGA